MSTTTSRILISGVTLAERELLRHWCNECASNGGSFQISSDYSDNWYTTYTINWPDDVATNSQALAAQGGKP